MSRPAYWTPSGRKQARQHLAMATSSPNLTSCAVRCRAGVLPLLLVSIHALTAGRRPARPLSYDGRSSLLEI